MFKLNKSDTLITRFFIPSALRVMIGEWANLAQFITEHARPMKEKISVDDSHQDFIPSESQLNDALNGPYQGFISQCLNAQARIARVRIAHQINESDFFTKEQTLGNPDQIPERQFKQTSIAECDSLTKAVDDLVGQFVQQWQDDAYSWLEQVINTLTQHQLEFSELELKELADDEPISDVINRFTDLKVEQPKLPKTMGFSAYYKLKATLALHSVLSRLQKPHAAKDIDQLMKPLRPVFEQIDQQEKQLLETQQAELMRAIQPINYDIEKPKKKS